MCTGMPKIGRLAEHFGANVPVAAGELYPTLPVPVEVVVHLQWENAARPSLWPGRRAP
jgi:hypothetical protein